VTALLLAAIDGTGVQTDVALSADHLVAVVFLGKNAERGLNDTTTQAKNQVESGLLLDVVVGESPSVFQLLSSEDESLLIGGDSLLVLDLGLDIFNGVRWLNVKSDGLSSQSLDEDLHASSESEHQVKGLIPSGCCSQKGSCRLQVASRRR